MVSLLQIFTILKSPPQILNTRDIRVGIFQETTSSSCPCYATAAKLIINVIIPSFPLTSRTNLVSWYLLKMQLNYCTVILSPYSGKDERKTVGITHIDKWQVC